jgi:hypothetical protein
MTAAKVPLCGMQGHKMQNHQRHSARFLLVSMQALAVAQSAATDVPRCSRNAAERAFRWSMSASGKLIQITRCSNDIKVLMRVPYKVYVA